LRIVVCAKQVVDLAQIRMNRETREPILSGIPLIIGDIEKNVLEEATRIKEQHKAEVIALSIGWPQPDGTILECLGRGADRAVMLADPIFETLSSTGVATVLAKAIEKIGDYALILLGEGSTDNNSGQVGPMVAQILGLPLVSYARQLEIVEDKVRIVKGLEDCFETAEASLPVVVTVSAEINEPRIPTILDVMEASSKPQESWSLGDIEISREELEQHHSVKVLSNQYPEQTRKNILFQEELGKSVDSLLQNLVKEGVLER